MNVNQSDKTNFTGDPLKRIIRTIIVNIKRPADKTGDPVFVTPSSMADLPRFSSSSVILSKLTLRLVFGALNFSEFARDIIYSHTSSVSYKVCFFHCAASQYEFRGPV